MITADDIVKYHEFSRVIERGDFEVKGHSMIPIALLFKWYTDLGPKLVAAEKSLKQEAPKETTEPFKKKDKKKAKI